MTAAPRVVVTGSIATDYLMRYTGRFTDALVPDRLATLSLSFLVDRMRMRPGGVAANIAYGLTRLGLRPTLVGAVGSDYAADRLAGFGVDTSGLRVSATELTARFLCTTDDAQNQIAAFHTGAMAEARHIGLAPVVGTLGGVDLVLVAPNDPVAMLRHTRECQANGWAFAADPSQQLASVDGADVRSLVESATWLFTNEYEHGLLLDRTGWTDEQVLSRVGAWVTTLGAGGVVVESAGERSIKVAAVADLVPVDPTGVGDAFRAGFVAGIVCGLGVQRAAQLGCVLAGFVLTAEGAQDYDVGLSTLLSTVGRTYGGAAEVDLAAHVGSVTIDRGAGTP
ncbi:carbohydrate kinase family protein [Actinokineospora inagensis]|uniref:carbohydrate kinase family protein n=1 Tax=Actinokineospora inagensis TaxID=103730 RepID=UPI0003F90613|nr:carbohydrate kinase family protein [Actinokineospora inagensis]